MGFLTIFLALTSGCWLTFRCLGLRQPSYALPIGLGLGVALFLLELYLLLYAGLPLERAAFVAPVISLFLGLWGHVRPGEPRYGRELTRLELVILVAAALVVWLFTNLCQATIVDDDYWLHTPIQRQLSRGEWPPTNPFFPGLELGGHFARDLLIVSVSSLTGQDIFAAQNSVTSFCHSLGLILLYLALRSEGSAVSATAGTAMIWLGMNVSGRVGLVEFYQNNGALTYFLLALLMGMLMFFWKAPERRFGLGCGLLLSLLGLVYESHFGLVVLSLLSLLPLLPRSARSATLGVLVFASVFGLLGGGALSRLAMPGTVLEKSIANQSQTVKMSFPKFPLMSLRIESRHSGPVSIGYRTGIGPALLWMLDHTPSRVDDRYVRLWSWMVVRMHWLGVWLAPLSALLLWRSQNRAGMFLWMFGLWGYLVPGLFYFGEIHEYEWLRWEFAAGYGFAGAAGAAFGQFAEGKRRGVALGLTLLLFSSAGLGWVWRQSKLIPTVSPRQVLGGFDTPTWLLRHGDHLRLSESDLRTLDWISVNPARGRGGLVHTVGPTKPWDILFESTVMGLTDLRAVGHQLPLDNDPIGLPPYRIREVYREFLKSPTAEWAGRLGIDWIMVRSRDIELEKRLLKVFPLVYIDARSADGRRRLLFLTENIGALEVPKAPAGLKYAGLTLPKPSLGEEYLEVTFPSPSDDMARLRTYLPAVETEVTLLAPFTATSAEVRFLGESVDRSLRIPLQDLPISYGP